jgi:hypothetical protein
MMRAFHLSNGGTARAECGLPFQKEADIGGVKPGIQSESLEKCGDGFLDRSPFDTARISDSEFSKPGPVFEGACGTTLLCPRA